MDRLEIQVLEFIKQNIPIDPGDVVLIGVSGGADSVALFRALYAIREKLEIELHVVHVEHGIRGEDSIGDAAFTSELVESVGLPIDVCHVDVPAYSSEFGLSEEEAARILRYRAFRQVKERIEASSRKVHIAVAHHKEDSVETFLLQLIRGTGLKGLSGLRPVRDDVIRPLLNLEKRDLVEYLNRLGQDYRTDETNFDDEILRNRMRHTILPELKGMNARAYDHILHSARIIDEAERYISKCANAIIDECEGGRIMCSRLLELDDVLRTQVILELVRRATTRGKDVSAKQIKAIDALTRGADSKTINLSNGIRALKKDGALYIVPDAEIGEALVKCENHIFFKPKLGEMITIDTIDYEIEVEAFERKNVAEIQESKYTKWFDYDKIETNLCLRNRQEGDFLQLADDKSQLLRRYFINEKIPAGERTTALLVANNQEIYWVVGYRTGFGTKITDGTTKILRISARRKENE